MNVSLSPEQLEWLEARVAAGEFSSVSEALERAVAELIAINEDDLAWAKPYVDEAIGQAERGEVVSGEEFLKSVDERIEKLRSR
jgi:antitoxin ParD1/3/4